MARRPIASGEIEPFSSDGFLEQDGTEDAEIFSNGWPDEKRKAKRWGQKYKDRRFFRPHFLPLVFLWGKTGGGRGMFGRRIMAPRLSSYSLPIIPLANLLQNERLDDGKTDFSCNSGGFDYKWSLKGPMPSQHNKARPESDRRPVPGRRWAEGFTLIELLVVVAIIAIL